MWQTISLGAVALKDPTRLASHPHSARPLFPSSTTLSVMQGMIDRNESLTHRSFLAVRGPFGSIPLLLRRALGSPAERLTQGGFVALFSRKKKPATAPQANPFVTDRDPVSPEPTPTPVKTEMPPEQPEVFAPRPAGRPEATFPRSKRVSMSLTEAEHQAWVSAADGQPLSTWARHQVQAQLEAG